VENPPYHARRSPRARSHLHVATGTGSHLFAPRPGQRPRRSTLRRDPCREPQHVSAHRPDSDDRCSCGQPNDDFPWSEHVTQEIVDTLTEHLYANHRGTRRRRGRAQSSENRRRPWLPPTPPALPHQGVPSALRLSAGGQLRARPRGLRCARPMARKLSREMLADAGPETFSTPDPAIRCVLPAKSHGPLNVVSSVRDSQLLA
jgi:hypothetical protein